MCGNRRIRSCATIVAPEEDNVTVVLDCNEFAPPTDVVNALSVRRLTSGLGTPLPNIQSILAWATANKGRKNKEGLEVHKIANILFRLIRECAEDPNKGLQEWRKTPSFQNTIQRLLGEIRAGKSVVLHSILGEENGKDRAFGWRWVVYDSLSEAAEGYLQEYMEFDGQESGQQLPTTIGAGALANQTMRSRLENDVPWFDENELADLDESINERDGIKGRHWTLGCYDDLDHLALQLAH